MKLNEYDPKAKCPKCGYGSVSTSYCGKPMPLRDCWQQRDSVPKEHLHRSCERCHYEWLEQCIKKGVSHEPVPSVREAPVSSELGL